jgi:uncharacterized repeat protein (TIGR01451 family)
VPTKETKAARPEAFAAFASRATAVALCLLLALAASGILGCLGGSQNSGYGPSFFTSESHVNKLEVKALRGATPVRTQQLLIATINDADGSPQRRQRVEWRLEGAGAITEVDENGLFLTHNPKGNTNSTVSYTDFLSHKIGRNIGHSTDDIEIKAGQTWCVIESAVEGETHVTASAPDIKDAVGNHVTITHRWLDAGWNLQPSISGPYGTMQSLNTTVFRQNDRKQGLAGYRVRYRILDGPPAVFVPNQTPEQLVTTDPNGLGAVRIAQSANGGVGRNRVAVEVLAPPLFGEADGGKDAVLGEGETVVDWQPPAVSLQESIPPSVHLGQDVTTNLTLSNNTMAPVPNLTVQASLADGMTYVRSDPPAFQKGNDLVWTLDPLAGRGRRTLAIVSRPARTGTFAGKASVTGDNLRDDRQLQYQVLPAPQARLRVEIMGPTTGLLMRGGNGAQSMPLTEQVVVSSLGTDTAANVRLRVELSPELEHKSGINPLEWSLGSMPPGTRQTVPLVLIPHQDGRGTVRVTALTGNNLPAAPQTPASQVQAQAEQVVLVRETGISLTMTGPRTRYVGKPFTWNLVVKNNGKQPLAQVTVSDTLPLELDFVQANEGGVLSQGREVVWMLERLNPGEEKPLQLITQANRVAGEAVNRVRVSAASMETEKGREGLLVSSGGPGSSLPTGAPVHDEAEGKVILHGIPAFKLRVAGKGPVDVGERVIYSIDVENTGSLPGSGVQVVATLSPQMRFLAASGVQYRVDGPKVTFAPVANLSPNQTLQLRIETQAVQAGDARFRAELTSASMQQPVVKENSVHVGGYPITKK